jgi:hypothetical protein
MAKPLGYQINYRSVRREIYESRPYYQEKTCKVMKFLLMFINN